MMPMLSTLFPITTERKLSQPINASLPMLLTLPVIVTEVILLHWVKAFSLMRVTPLSITRLEVCLPPT